jgi:hypothetical protein
MSIRRSTCSVVASTTWKTRSPLVASSAGSSSGV